MFFATGATDTGSPSSINLRCPACLHNDSFHGFPKVLDLDWTNGEPRSEGYGSIHYLAGVRQCPNMSCQAIVTVFLDTEGNETIYPPEIIDFDATNLPENILSSLEEAVKCHAAGCYRASALLVRRVLEELCDDKGATGANLKLRITALNGVAVIPGDLLNAADDCGSWETTRHMSWRKTTMA